MVRLVIVRSTKVFHGITLNLADKGYVYKCTVTLICQVMCTFDKDQIIEFIIQTGKPYLEISANPFSAAIWRAV